MTPSLQPLWSFCDSIDYGLTASASTATAGPKFLRITDIVGEGIDWASVPSVECSVEDASKYRLHHGDVVIARTGATTGCSAYIKNPPEAVFASYLVRLRVSEENDPRYVAYALQSSFFWEWIHSVMDEKAAQPNASASTMAKALLPKPAKSKQAEIARILGQLDDKIELNRRMCATLEDMARAIFRSWFVDFDPVRAKVAAIAEGRDPERAAMAAISGKKDEDLDALPHASLASLRATAALFPSNIIDSDLGEVPDGWSVKTIGELAIVVDCLHSKKPLRQSSGRILLQLNNIREDGLLDLSDSFLISDGDFGVWTSRMLVGEGDCVITNVGRVGAVAQIPRGVEAALGRNMTGMRTRPSFPYPSLFVTALLSDYMKQEIEAKKDVGTILDALNVKNIPRLRLPVPGDELLRNAEALLRPMRKLMEQKLQESHTLAALRDTLLPKLLYGGD